MLVIRRRPGERIHIGEGVEIEIMACGPSRVKLGVRAPKEIPVWRAEAKATREQNIAAAGWRGSVPPAVMPAGWRPEEAGIPLPGGPRK